MINRVEPSQKSSNEQPGSHVVELARSLIQAPSPNPPGDERAVAQVIIDALRDRDMADVEILSKEDARPNLLTTLEFGPGGQHLCLSGHMDTKPVGEARWGVDPFEGSMKDGQLYGLGSCDMKGALAAMIEAASVLKASDLSAGRLSLLFTADEENASSYGSRFLIDVLDRIPDAMIIGEPGGIHQDWDRLHLLGRGIANFRVRVFGDQGHSSLSATFGLVNASVEMAKLLVAFAEGFTPRHSEHPLVPEGPTVNAGVRVQGGVGYGVVPGEAEFACDVRVVPGMSRSLLEEDLKDFLGQQMNANPQLHCSFEFEPDPTGWLPPSEVASTDPVASAAREAMRRMIERVPPDSAFPGTTDAAWFCGRLGIPTLPALGPGLLRRAHAADEYVSVNSIETAARIYAEAGRLFCAGRPLPPSRESSYPDGEAE